MTGKSQPLNAKDIASFQQALGLYEKKEYEKSLAEVDAVIRRRKERVHGESLCLKGLLLFHLNKAKDEGAYHDAELLIDQGTTIDSKSHVAWHMAGIFYKLRQDYVKAYKCFIKSYSLNQNNPNVYQDIAMLAAQERDFNVLVEIRRKALAQNMGMRMLWLGLIAAQFLARQFKELEKTVDLFIRVVEVDASTQKTTDVKNTEAIQISEVLMLCNRAIIRQNEPDRALKNLVLIEPRVRDKLAWLETEAELMALLKLPAAEEKYRSLVKRNPGCVNYLKSLESIVLAKSPSSDDSLRVGLLHSLYTELETELPRATAIKLRHLEILDASSPEFASKFLDFVKSQLARNVLTAFVLVQPFYTNSQVPKLVDENLASFEQSDNKLAVAVFKACHYSEQGLHDQALATLEAPGVAPTAAKDESAPAADLDVIADFNLAYARILANAGDFTKSSEVLNETSNSLKGDVLLNTRAAQAGFRALDLETGYKHAFEIPIRGKHAKNDEEAMKYLVNLECCNSIINMARAHATRQEHGMALKRALQVTGIFDSYYLEQYDFHYYGPRVGTLRTYIDVVNWENRVYDHPVYIEAVEIACREWVSFNAKYSDCVDESKAQSARKWRKQQLDKLDLKADADPFGIAALESKDGLTNALKLLSKLKTQKPLYGRTYLLEAEIYATQKKYILAAQALKKAKDNGAEESQIAGFSLLLLNMLNQDTSASPVIKTVPLKIIPAVADKGDIINSNINDYSNEFVTDLLDWLKTRRVLGCLDSEAVEYAASKLPELKRAEDVERAVLELRRAGVDVSVFTDAVKRLWPRASFVN